MSFSDQGPSRYLDDALDRRDDALYRTRRILFLVAGGAATASVALGVVFAQELPGHSAAAAPAKGAAQPSSAAPSQPGSGAASGGQSSAAQPQPAQQPAQSTAPAPPAPAPAPPQVVSGGS